MTTFTIEPSSKYYVHKCVGLYGDTDTDTWMFNSRNEAEAYREKVNTGTHECCYVLDKNPQHPEYR